MHTEYGDSSRSAANPSPSAFETLVQPPLSYPDVVSFYPNPQYERYLRMHKVILGRQGAEQLEDIYKNLRSETMPRYLVAAGWAAAEAALIRSDMPAEARQELLWAGVDCWHQALERQKQFNASRLECMVEHAYPHRIALDIAVAPLLEGVIVGDVNQGLRRRVFKDCLNIAQSNAVHINLLSRANEIEGVGDHRGFGYECNALLAFNMRFSRGWFVIPSMARSDTGYHHRQQTHDLLIVHHRGGELINTTPIEIKAVASVRDRARYEALLVRGKMHLSFPGKHSPESTLKAIEAVHEGWASNEEASVVSFVTDQFVDMIRDYYAGEALGSLATKRALTQFRDNALVSARHPGLARVAQPA